MLHLALGHVLQHHDEALLGELAVAQQVDGERAVHGGVEPREVRADVAGVGVEVLVVLSVLVGAAEGVGPLDGLVDGAEQVGDAVVRAGHCLVLPHLRVGDFGHPRQ